jgi:hypothetical protein
MPGGDYKDFGMNVTWPQQNDLQIYTSKDRRGGTPRHCGSHKSKNKRCFYSYANVSYKLRGKQ